MTPFEADLTPYRDMPFEFARFAASQLVATSSPEGILAAIYLWGTSWHEKPAGSLTNDERVLARAAGYGRSLSEWRAVREEALRGWVECSDGRLYHRVLAEKVHEAWGSRLHFLHLRYKDAIRAFNKRNPHDEREPLSFERWRGEGRPKGVSDDSGPPVAPRVQLETDRHVPRTRDRNPTDFATESEQEGIGRKRKGRESTTTTTNVGVAQNENAVDDARTQAIDLHALSNRLCRLGGVASIQAHQIAMNLDTVKRWIAAGYDVDRDIVPAIEAQFADTKEESIGSLHFYSGRIAKSYARTAKAKPRTKRKVEQPELYPEGEDRCFTPMRQSLLSHLGSERYAMLCNSVRFTQDLNGRDELVLRIADPKPPGLKLYHDDRVLILDAVAASLGVAHVWDH